MQIKAIASFWSVFLILLFVLSGCSGPDEPGQSTIGNQARKEIYVSPEGHDDNAGNKEKPYLTLAKALQEAGAGSTIYLRQGTYLGNIIIDRGGSARFGPLTIMSYPGEMAKLIGRQNSSQAMITILNQSHIAIKNLEISGFSGGNEGVVLGISLLGAVRNVEISGNVIQGFSARHAVGIAALDDENPFGSKGARVSHLHIVGNDISHFHTFEVGYDTEAKGIMILGQGEDVVIADNMITDGRGVASAILVSGTAGKIQNLTLRGNTIDHMEAFPNAAVSIQENVDGFTVENNSIRNTNYHALEVYGGYLKDMGGIPQNGVVTGNVIEQNIGFQDVALQEKGEENRPRLINEGGAGIKLDAASHIAIEKNYIYGNGEGVVFGSEQQKRGTLGAEGITVRDNVISYNLVSGIRAGSHPLFMKNDTRYTEGVEIASNILFRNGYPNWFDMVMYGNLVLERLQGATIHHNVVVSDNIRLLVTPNAELAKRYKVGEEETAAGLEVLASVSYTMHHNIYAACKGNPYFLTKNGIFTDFSAFQKQPGVGEGSLVLEKDEVLKAVSGEQAAQLKELYEKDLPMFMSVTMAMDGEDVPVVLLMFDDPLKNVLDE